MINFEPIPTIDILESSASLRSRSRPELVHMDDPAITVLTDFSQSVPHTIKPEDTMDQALNEMKVHGVHVLLVMDDEEHIVGIIASEDLLGEKPIQIIQERRIPRDQVLVKMIMISLSSIVAFDIETVEKMRVGNVVKTMQAQKTHYALVLRSNDNNTQTIRGIFNTSQIGKQLHQDIANTISSASSVSELQGRKD